MRRAVAIVVLTVVTAAGCGDDDSADPAPAPLGLASVAMPASGPDIAAVLQRMPGEIDGIPAATEADFELIRRYGNLNTIVALPFSDGAAALAADLSRFQVEESAVVEGSQLEPDGGTLWVMGSFVDEGGAGVVHLLVWSAPGAEWVFNVSTESAEMREAIVTGFVEAIGSG